MVDVGLLLGLVLACLAGALLTVFQLPGTWLTLAAAMAYAWYYDWQRLGLWTIGLLAGLAVLAEVAELFTGVWFAKRAGGSRRAAWWGLFGGIIGAVVLTIPVPVIGTIIGAAIGCFAGAFLAEHSLAQGTTQAAKTGLLAAVGQTLGTVLKVAAALVMSGAAVASAIVNW